MTNGELRQLATHIRTNIIRMTTAAGSGHVSSSVSAVELMVGLFFTGIFRADVRRPQYPTNDRLIFSKGHAAPLLYALYAAAGVVPEKKLLTLRKFGSPLEGHPTKAFPYTETPSGSLGQGLSVALGEALGARMGKFTYRVFCLLGDSEMAEGSVWEAIELAGFLRVENLIGIIDLNGLGQSGPTMLGFDAEAIAKRVTSFGWQTILVDGHDLTAIHLAYRRAEKMSKPTMIIARTVKGQGISIMAGQEGWHGRALTSPEARQAVRDLGDRGQVRRGMVSAPSRHRPSAIVRQAAPALKIVGTAPIAPRVALGQGLVRLAKAFPAMVVIDGEVKNSTETERFATKFPKRFIEGYVAEQNIVGMATGLAARGWLPVSATFAAFWTRAFDQLRMASYARYHQVFIGTHAGVHIGQDGVSQMGLQDIALFSSLEHSTVLYPADAVAAQLLLERALRYHDLVYLRVTRAAVPVLYKSTQRFRIGGSMTLRSSKHDVATIVAAGITVHEALKSADQLAKRGTPVRVLDVYSLKPIDATTLTLAARQTKHLIVVEDHYVVGGMADLVRAALGSLAGTVKSLAVRKTPKSGRPEELLRYEGIDATAIVKTVQSLRR